MMKLVFVFVPVLVLSYVLWHVWNVLPFPGVAKSVVIALGLLSFLMLFSLAGLLERLPLGVASGVYETGTSSIFIFLYLALIFLVLDIGRAVHLVPKSWLYGNGVTSGVVTVLIAGLFIYGNVHYHHKSRQLLYLDAHGKVHHPVKIVMMSDMHLGYPNRRADLKKWIDEINKEKPDVVLIAGDVVDNNERPLKEERMAEEFSLLDAPVYACLGNHEYYVGCAEARQFYREAGIRLLRDSCATEGDLCIVGRDDRSKKRRASVAQLMQKSDRSKYVVLLDHQPYHLEEAEKAGVDFQLSGHTHDGQVWPVSLITKSLYECAYGDYKRGSTVYYVTSGIGIWGGKFRIGTRSEYVVATIQ